MTFLTGMCTFVRFFFLSCQCLLELFRVHNLTALYLKVFDQLSIILTSMK